tara:strand:+ start:102 stop:482 length:381 start_codon:yes stop_codon:yes gene_type:complete
MSTFNSAHIIPIELINKILITRPIHPVAKIFKQSIKRTYSTLDIENKMFYIINFNFVICISGNNYIYEGDVFKLDDDARIDLPFVKSGMEEIDILCNLFYTSCYCWPCITRKRRTCSNLYKCKYDT